MSTFFDRELEKRLENPEFAAGYYKTQAELLGGRVRSLESMLAECYREAGWDPGIYTTQEQADQAVEAVRELRALYDDARYDERIEGGSDG